MTDKQQGWNDALEIVLDTFRGFAWQKEQGDERERAALDMEKQVKHKGREKSQDYCQAIADVVRPFYKIKY